VWLRKKESTLASDVGRIKRHIKPLLGQLRVTDIQQRHIRDFLQGVARGDTAVDVKTGPRGRAIVRGGRWVASRALGLLGAILAFGIEIGALDINPVRGVRPFPEKRGERFLSIEELTRPGRVLRDAENRGVNASALNILRLLMLTGARRGEIDKLRWAEVDLLGRRLTLADSKAGRKSIPLNSAAISILASLKDNRIDDRFVFPSGKDEGHFKGTPKIWRTIRSDFGHPRFVSTTFGTHLLASLLRKGLPFCWKASCWDMQALPPHSATHILPTIL
jgi:integrase